MFEEYSLGRRNPEGTFNTRSAIRGCCSWDKIKKWVKCGLSIVAGTVTGVVTGCAAIGAMAFNMTGGVANLPVSGTAMISGCVVGGVTLGLASAAAGAVQGGCFD